MIRLLLAALVLTLSFVATADGPCPCADGRSPSLDRFAAPIRSPADLAAWLAGRRPEASDPLIALSPPARARFLASLRFGAQGLASFQSEDIQSELSASQAWRLLALFGLQSSLAAMPPLAVRSSEDAEVEAWRRMVALTEAP